MNAASILPALVAVASAPAASAHLVEGLVRLGQTADVCGPRVTPLRVVEDSRCPMNSRCVWAGRVALRSE